MCLDIWRCSRVGAKAEGRPISSRLDSPRPVIPSHKSDRHAVTHDQQCSTRHPGFCNSCLLPSDPRSDREMRLCRCNTPLEHERSANTGGWQIATKDSLELSYGNRGEVYAQSIAATTAYIPGHQT